MKQLVIVVLVIFIIGLIPTFECSKKPSAAARKEDIPYIKCQVCEKLAAELYHQVEKKQAEIAPKKISEYQIIEIAENVCNLKKAEADWILQIDIVEQGDKLELVDQNTEGQCNSECKTIERACQEVMGYSDTDVAEYLYSSKPKIDSLVNYLCKDLTKSCTTKPPPVPKDRTPGEPFVAKSSKEAEMEKMMRSMEGMPGAPGMKMYSRDDLMNMKNFGGEDDDEEEEEEEENFPSNLGKVLREKERKNNDWKNRITKGVSKAGEALKQHAYKVSNKVRHWWRAKTGGLKSSKPTKQEL
ncbi:uncharacterized protein LOC116406196 [Cucumis sativus]|uniref:Uncharacterized protein n=2 Tax=Cucumis sativus TaxID=3659 RepID=A0ACB6HC14_CUCSA|nr:uncharacterized protein LOC101206912 [Cucumis sativus]XP_031745746.1 uncharacterized protein LOC116406196 [Cucumis sativus]KAE8637456.1 hypothetical protein CSA_004489 [Cucumis sativus]KGN66215.1 hypothetical protein Csa_007540 [Cucumis sativus]